MASFEQPLGEYLKIYLARSKLKEVLNKRKVSGGAVTSILCYLLDKKIVDAAVVAKRVKGVQGEIIVARNRRDVLEAAGDRWNVVPLTIHIRELLVQYNLNKIVVVGLPCQAQFLGYMRTMPLLESDFGEKIYLLISLFCLGTFAVEAFLNYLYMNYHLKPEVISEIKLVKDHFVISSYEGQEINVPVKEALPYLQRGCLACSDYTGVFSDISAGISEKKLGYTVLIVRNEIGDKVVNDAYKNGYIEIKEISEKEVYDIREKAIEKIKRAMQFMPLVV